MAMTLGDLVAKVADPYERQARLYPALLVVLPLLATIMLLYAPQASSFSVALTIAISCGGLYLLTNLCREFGKRLEERLFQQWGGKPTTQLLRHRDKTIDTITKRRYHSFLATKINHAFPDEDQERNNPDAADEVYQSGIRWLLNHTRPNDSKKFDLLFKENVSYGFRRNALGLRPLGLIISIVSLLWALVAADVLVGSTHKYIDIAALSQMPAPAISCLTLSAVMILVWLVFFTRASLRTAAFTYAEMLLRACETL
jgi:ABC-type multidrug transport system fused ATPase/permease subunit